MPASIGFVTYPVRDIDASIAFYRDALDLGEPRHTSEHWIEFDLGNSALALTDQGEMVGAVPGSQFSIGFEVDDLERTIERLRAAGATIDTEFEGPTCRAAFVRDPDGNRFAVHRLKRS